MLVMLLEGLGTFPELNGSNSHDVGREIRSSRASVLVEINRYRRVCKKARARWRGSWA